MNKLVKVLLIIFIAGTISIFVYDCTQIGKVIDSYKNVSVYYNGIFLFKSHGKSFSPDEYYYGQKWQCVEFVKRFYLEAKHHKMPNVYGNAKDFFDVTLPQGALNKSRNLRQFKNSEEIPPEEDDILVFNDTKYGHVAIVSKVHKDKIEIVQQNIWKVTREFMGIRKLKNKYIIGNKRMPIGWLRK